MSRRMGSLTLDTLDDLPRQCRGCVFWEVAPECTGAQVRGACDDPALDKEAWVSATLLEWGSCGRIAYVDGMPAGFITYADPRYVPRAAEFPSGPASADAALLMTAHVTPAYAEIGLGRLLVQAAAHDLAKRGITALEAFGDTRGETGACVAPAEFFRAVGFKTVRAHPHYPRLRLDLRRLPGWGTGAGAIEHEVERWLASVTPA
ncbi:GNAT family N-acetyltransferase [Stackebrandtia nassauensis]|uniref:GCN5-related N-acetyltransferase n=1 Tax=Stackebrandtia nassauensis (strain DSM 44728 / CIP 108903 / NRRL B-16338 / NBRC 102104 / LLR-40K-21) TaxID=446470 RepID=D3Q5I4_STANL|nr:GCN5-related N-acetyltransferase [Stackebrandtia nassauensis DSM 44728]